MFAAALSQNRKNGQTQEDLPRANPSSGSYCSRLAASECTLGMEDQPGITDAPRGRPNTAGVTDATQGRVIGCRMTDASHKVGHNSGRSDPKGCQKEPDEQLQFD